MELMFSRKDLKRLIVPLIIEQFLAVAVGMADIIMVSAAGESAVSGVSLVDTINVLLINIFAALATGGAVITAQYLGKRNRDNARSSANQLILSSGAISIAMMVIALIGNRAILQAIFGQVDSSVMRNAQIYFFYTALSFPFLSLYNSCAALFRAMGNSKVSMFTSLIMNIINIAGNAILIYGAGLGVAGVSIPTLVSRVVAAVIMLILIRKPIYTISLEKFSFRFNFPMIRQILRIGIPNGLENSMFQIGKILVMSLIASFGTAAIAANAVSMTVSGFATIPGSAIGLALVTIVGQCVGAGDYEQAVYYTKKMMKITITALAFTNLFIFVFAPQIFTLYNLTPETKELALTLIRYYNVMCIVFWPLSFTMANPLRAAGDVKFTMVIAIISMWVWRVGFSYVLGNTFGLGVFGVWVAMTMDWIFRGFAFTIRFLKGGWKDKQVITSNMPA